MCKEKMQMPCCAIWKGMGTKLGPLNTANDLILSPLGSGIPCIAEVWCPFFLMAMVRGAAAGCTAALPPPASLFPFCVTIFFRLCREVLSGLDHIGLLADNYSSALSLPPS